MNRQIEISIIMPIYNGERYLQKSIDSVLRQTFANFELILVDDGSTDSSLQICRSYCEKDSRIVVVEQAHSGLIYARKNGISVAKAPYIGFIDCDDWIDAEMYEQMYKALELYRPDLISTGIVREYEMTGGTEVVTDFYPEGLYTSLEEDIYPTMVWDFRRGLCGISHNLVIKLFHRDLLFEVYREIDENVYFGEDALTFYTYCMKARSIYIIRSAYYHYRIHADSMCHENNNPALMENMMRLYQGLRSAFQGAECEWVLLRQLRRYMMEINSHMLRKLFAINPDIYRGWYFSCEELLERRLVLYGAGTCGQAFYQYAMKKGKEKNIVAWLDRLGPEKNTECLHEIKKPEILLELDYDFLIVAVLDEELRDEIVRDLCSRYGVKRERIRWEGGAYEMEK